MGKIKTCLMILTTIFVLIMAAFASPLKDSLINHFFYITGDHPYPSSISISEHLPSQLGFWSADEKGWRYISDSGEAAAGKSMFIGDNEYFFNKDGYMITGWIENADTWSYLSYAGRKETGWITIDNRRYYLDKDGLMTTGWSHIDNREYYFDENGHLASGWVLQDGQYYFLNNDGTPHTGWLVENDKYYYLEPNGAMRTGWIEESGFWFYLGETGEMTTGWQTIANKSYYFTSTGEMHTGWLEDGGSTYFFNKDGAISTGWLLIGGNDYYMDPHSGAMNSNNWIYDGNGAYFLGSNGIWVPNKKLSDGPTIALTFDDGPATYTDQLLECLKDNQARATFFVLGSLVDRYPDTLRKMIAMECEIGNHSYSHANLTTLSDAAIKREIDDTNNKIKAITGHDTLLVRPPGGSYNGKVRSIINAPIIMWSLDTLDWRSKNTEVVIEKVLNNVKDGDIILMHDIHPTSLEAAKILIPALKSMGYNLVTVSELAAAKGQTLEPQQIYNSF